MAAAAGHGASTQTISAHLEASVPAGLVDVALIDAKAFAAAMGFCISKLHDEVRSGAAPQPVIRRPRFTRWRMADVREYLIKVAAEGLADPRREDVVKRATAASREGQIARRAAAARGAK